MSDLALIAQWLLALVLVVSGVAKLTDRTASADALVGFGVPARLRWAAPVVPLVELGLAVLLVVPSTARWGAIGAVALLGMFSVAIAVNLARGRRPACNCFGKLTAGPISGRTLARNGALVALAVVAAVPEATKPGDLFSDVSVPVVLGVLAALVVAAVLAGLVWLVIELWRQQARLLERLDALEADHAGASSSNLAGTPSTNAGPPVGGPAPDSAGADAYDTPVTLAQHWSPGRLTLVVFGDPACAACTSLHPVLASWFADRRGQRQVVVVSRTARAPVPEGATLFVEHGRSASEAYGVTGTPSALLVDGSGTVASALAEGADAIRELLADADERTTAPVRLRPRPARPGQVIAGLDLPSETDPGQASVLVFWNERCTHCRSMAETLGERAGRPGGGRLVFIVPSAEQASAVTGRSPDITALVDADLRVNLALGVPGTPSAALVDEDGRLLQEIAIGPEAVLALVDSTSRAPATHR